LKLALTGQKINISIFPMVMPFVARKDNTCTYTHRSVYNNNNNNNKNNNNRPVSSSSSTLNFTTAIYDIGYPLKAQSLQQLPCS
jgi:hypothetical protein